MPKLAAGSPAMSGGVATWSGSTKRTVRRAVRIDEKSQKDFAVAIQPAHDLLLPPMPLRVEHELIEHCLHVGDEPGIGGVPLASGRPVGVARADQIADPVLVAVDGELVGHGQQPAFDADLAQLRSDS